MRSSLLLPALLLLAALEPRASHAQDASSIHTAVTESQPARNEGLIHVPALTPLLITVDEEITSNRHKSGDRFRIVIAEDVRVGNAVVIPAGSVGEGEVVHAAKSGAGGKAGELILAARVVRVGDIEIRLRSMVIGGTGRDRAQTSLNVSIAAGVFGMLVRGGVMIVPPGTLASAKTAVDIDLPATEPAVPPAEAQPEETTNEGEEHVPQPI